jgi:hypothetical protein
LPTKVINRQLTITEKTAMNTIFNILINEFAQSKGLDIAPSTQGLEFECEDTRVYIVQHPLHNDRLLAEVTVTTFEDEPTASLLALMMQINEAARFEHDWLIVMDPEWQVSLTTSITLPGLNATQLEAWMLDGVNRAQTLQSMLEAGVSVTDSNDKETSDLNPLLMVRG